MGKKLSIETFFEVTLVSLTLKASNIFKKILINSANFSLQKFDLFYLKFSLEFNELSLTF